MNFTPEEKIRKVAQEEAKHIIDVANATASALAASTAKDIATIQTDIQRINDKLDGKYATKEELNTVTQAFLTFQSDYKAIENRTRTIENLVNQGTGGAWAINGTISIISAIITILLYFHFHGN